MSGLRVSEEEDLYEDAPCGYLSTLPDGTIVRVNRTFEAWTGHEREGLLWNVRFQDLLAPGGGIYYETHFQPLLLMQGAVREIALEVVRADGSRLPVLVNATLRRDEAGAPELIRTTVFDASDRRAYERELLAARREAERLAAENARLYERERATALALQRSLLADQLPRDPRCPVAAYYAPAVETLEVGGDWYDVVCPVEDRMVLVVGDVVGKGLSAAAAMGQLRSALRALMVSGLSPREALLELDRFVEFTEDARGATVAVADLEVPTGRLRLACAGHPPPVLVRPGDPGELLWEGRSPPLGTQLVRGGRDEHVMDLPPGARLLFYTDGAVERRDRPLDVGMELLRDAFAERTGAIADVVSELSLQLAAEQHGGDDVCMLACVVGAAERFEQRIPADPAALSPMRHALSDWLGMCGLGPDARDTVVLACSEVVANAIEHGLRGSTGEVELRVDVGSGTVEICVHDDGDWRERDAGSLRGRGLQIVEHLMDTVDIDRSAGTTVRMRWTGAV